MKERKNGTTGKFNNMDRPKSSFCEKKKKATCKILCSMTLFIQNSSKAKTMMTESRSVTAQGDKTRDQLQRQLLGDGHIPKLQWHGAHSTASIQQKTKQNTSNVLSYKW